MQKIILSLPFLIMMTTISAQESDLKTTTYFLIRHAEKVRSDAKNLNPDLDERGIQRAQKWKDIFQFIDFQYIYSTNFTRTIKTVEPIALEKNIEISMYHPTKIDFELFKNKTLGKNILIVGHSNSIPQFVNVLINQEKYKEVDDTEFSHLYIITIKGNQISDHLLYIDF
ncbi:MAG: phosphoglycerate mutase family protein [Flavobacteriaceae bacterium]|nr:phosphoglycerate mutase family protein [Flavobacteriaceae bacterium]